jgi:hypothetical protein
MVQDRKLSIYQDWLLTLAIGYKVGFPEQGNGVSLSVINPSYLGLQFKTRQASSSKNKTDKQKNHQS